MVGDDTRVSEVVAEQPYMGIGKDWPVPTTSWCGILIYRRILVACIRHFRGRSHITTLVDGKMNDECVAYLHFVCTTIGRS